MDLLMLYYLYILFHFLKISLHTVEAKLNPLPNYSATSNCIVCDNNTFEARKGEERERDSEWNILMSDWSSGSSCFIETGLVESGEFIWTCSLDSTVSGTKRLWLRRETPLILTFNNNKEGVTYCVNNLSTGLVTFFLLQGLVECLILILFYKVYVLITRYKAGPSADGQLNTFVILSLMWARKYFILLLLLGHFIHVFIK